MSLSTPFFLFLFLPVCLAFFHAAPKRARMAALLVLSLCFYALADPSHLPVLLLAVLANHAAVRAIGRAPQGPGRARRLALGVGMNLLLLAGYKYLPFFVKILEDLGALPPGTAAGPFFADWTLPLGVSFFTFAAISRLADAAGRTDPPGESLAAFTLFLAFFPKILAGPIARHGDIREDLAGPSPTLQGAALGVRRLCAGLAKKALIAQPLGVFADAIFSAAPKGLDAPSAWLGLASYSLQIYYDFSGYTDMAIGLGLLFGVRLPENFNAPYLSRSVREFWRRWHITLSAWFRDYLYIPLGGSRNGPLKTYRNLLIVFVLCGLWHGAGWPFLVWGLWHGMFLCLERLFAGRIVDRAPRIFGHVYGLLAVCLGWVFFRAPDFSTAWSMFCALVPLGGGAPGWYAGTYATREVLAAMAAGVVCCGAFNAPLAGLWVRARGASSGRDGQGPGARLAANCGALLLFLLAVLAMAAAGQESFIYARF